MSIRNRVGAPNSQYYSADDGSKFIEKEKPPRRKLVYISIIVGCGVLLYLVLGMMELDVRNSYSTRTSGVCLFVLRVLVSFVSASKDGDYSIVINTFERHDMMKEAIQHYSQCAGVKSIHIVWSEKKLPNKKLAAEYARIDKPKVSVFRCMHSDHLLDCI